MIGQAAEISNRCFIQNSSPANSENFVSSARSCRMNCHSTAPGCPSTNSWKITYSAEFKMSTISPTWSARPPSTEVVTISSSAIEELQEVIAHLGLIKARKGDRQDVLVRSPQATENKRVEWSEGRSPGEKMQPLSSSRPGRKINDFRHNELIQFWKPNRSSDQPGDDVDRLNKLVLTLTCSSWLI